MVWPSSQNALRIQTRVELVYKDVTLLVDVRSHSGDGGRLRSTKRLEVGLQWHHSWRTCHLVTNEPTTSRHATVMAGSQQVRRPVISWVYVGPVTGRPTEKLVRSCQVFGPVLRQRHIWTAKTGRWSQPAASRHGNLRTVSRLTGSRLLDWSEWRGERRWTTRRWRGRSAVEWIQLQRCSDTKILWS